MESRLEYKHIRNSMQPIKLRSCIFNLAFYLNKIFLVSYIWNPALTIDNALSIVPVGKDSLKIFSSGVVEYIQT